VAKTRIHGILGDLHKLLSVYSASDFLEASHYVALSQRMKEVLRALAQEAGSGGHVAPPQASNGSTATQGRVRSLRPDSLSNVRGDVLAAVRQSPYSQSNRAMVTFARSLGLKLQANPKDSRDRVARRLASLLERMPQDKKDEAITGLLSGRSTQTQGWIDVIKSTNQ
jgi:hypothetical protein